MELKLELQLQAFRHPGGNKFRVFNVHFKSGEAYNCESSQVDLLTDL
jgi:hypothetical protein